MTQRQNIFCFITVYRERIHFRVSRDAKPTEHEAAVLATGSDIYEMNNIDDRYRVLSLQLSRLITTYRVDELQIRNEF